jgi:hypothetical protein
MMNNKLKKYLTISGVILIFIATFIYSAPASLLSTIINHYSNSRLVLYNTTGTFWNGSGLLVGYGPKLEKSDPIVLLNWHVKIGTQKLIDVVFDDGVQQIAEVHFNFGNIVFDNLNITLSTIQIAHLVNLINAYGISANIVMHGSQIMFSKEGNSGTIEIQINNMVLNLSHVNPIGSYLVKINMADNNISVTSQGHPILTLNGTGNFDQLMLNLEVQPQYQKDLATILSLLGHMQTNGLYQVKVF